MIKIRESEDLSEAFGRLGVRMPTGLAILPRNLLQAVNAEELIDPQHASTLRSMWRQAGLRDDAAPSSARRSWVQKDASFLLPTIFASSLILREQPEVVELALKLAAQTALDQLRGILRHQPVQLKVVIEKKDADSRRFVEVEYEGPADGMDEILKAVKENE